MAKGSPDNINHLGAVRFRVKGSGILRTRVYSFGSVNNKNLPNITLTTAGHILPTVLTNFEQQKMMLEVRTETENEYFILSKLIPFLVPVAVEYPR